MATRIDSWCGALDTYKQAEIYLKWIGRDADVTWETFVAWAVEEYGLDRTPSRNAFYAWAAKPGESAARATVRGRNGSATSSSKAASTPRSS